MSRYTYTTTLSWGGDALEAVVAERAYEREHGLKHALVTAADKMADAALSQALPPKGEEL